MLRIWKAQKNDCGIKYVTVDEHDNIVGKYKKLGDVRKDYKTELAMGIIEIQRNLDKVYDPIKP